MAVSVQDVRDESFTGEFNLISASKIQHAIDEAADHYTNLPKRKARLEVIARLTSLHAAHIIHQALKYEGGPDEGGGDGQSAPVKSASLVRVGSWTFASADEMNASSQGNLPIEDWRDSPYGRRWRTLWSGVPTAATTTRRA